MRKATNIARKNLISLGTCIGKYTKSGKFHLQITALDLLAPYAKVSLMGVTILQSFGVYHLHSVGYNGQISVHSVYAFITDALMMLYTAVIIMPLGCSVPGANNIQL